MVKQGYEHVDVTFSRKNETEMELYEFIQKEGKLLGNAKYIKQVLYKEMEARKK